MFIIIWFTLYCTARFIKIHSADQLIFFTFYSDTIKKNIGKEFKCWPIKGVICNNWTIDQPKKSEPFFFIILTEGNNFLTGISCKSRLKIYAFANKAMCDGWDATIKQVESRVNYSLQKNVLIGRLDTIPRWRGIDIIHHLPAVTLYHDGKIKITSRVLWVIVYYISKSTLFPQIF